MRYGKTLHVSQLRLGDVVRAVRGSQPLHPLATGFDANCYKCREGINKAGSADDFREGYDVMTVTDIDEDFISFQRPHIHIWEKGERRVRTVEVGVEFVERIPRTHGGLFYELLSYGPEGSEERTAHWEDGILVRY